MKLFILGMEDILAISRKYKKQHARDIIQQFFQFLKIPNVVSKKDNIHKNADLIKKEFGKRGVRMKLYSKGGAPPVVYGTLTVPGAKRTIG